MKHPDYLQILIALDQLLNTIAGGYADETISSRAYRAYSGTGPKWPYRLINAVFFWQPEHCFNAYKSEIERHQLPACFRGVKE